MRILLLSHYYWPEVGAPQRRWNTLVERFVACGHQIVVVAPHPHYPHSSRDDFFASSVGLHGRRVPVSLSGTWESGRHGETIMRVPYVHSGRSMARQLVDQSVAALGSVAAVMRHLRGPRRPHAVISTTPPLPFLLAGDRIARSLRIPHIAEVRDAWPDLISELSLVTSAAGRILPRRVRSRLENDLLPDHLTAAQRRATAVVVTTESFASRLRERGISATVVRSGVSRSELESEPARTPRGSGAKDLKVLYVGTVGRSQDLASVIRAVALTKGVSLRVVGDGALKEPLRALASEIGAHVEFFPQTAGAELAAMWAWADAGLVSLGDVPAHLLTVPSKLYSLMARRIPVVGVVEGEAAQIISENGAGSVARPGDVGSIVAALERHMAENLALDGRARDWVIANASSDVMAADYEALLKKVSS